MLKQTLSVLKKFVTTFKQQGFFVWIWLIYLLYPIVYLATLPLKESWLGFVLVILFVVNYALCHGHSMYLKIYLSCLMLNILAYCVLYDANYYFMIFFVTFLVSRVDKESLRWVHIFGSFSIALFGFVIYWYWDAFQAGQLYYMFVPLMLSIAMPYGLWTHDKSQRLKKQLHSANDEIERLIKNQERQRIARDLHDTLGHTLSLITLKSELAGKLVVKDPERAAQEIKEIQATSRSALKQLRDLLAEMHSITLEHEIQAAEQILKAADIKFEYTGDADILDAVPLVRNMLALCLREAINNVVKHSHATRCKIQLVESTSEIRIDVMDDGVGLADQSGANNSQQSGRGIIGIQERLNLIEGKLQLGRMPEGGTLLSMIVPRIVKGIAVRGNAE